MKLSKSIYCAGVQCPKILWLEKNMPEKSEERSTMQFEIGNLVGDYAMRFFGEFTEIPFDKELNKMTAQTKELLKAENIVLAEASFSWENNFCSVDILRKTGNTIELVEVKSSTNVENQSAAKINPIYLQDIAYQYYVLKHCGFTPIKCSLLQLNKKYVRNGDIDINKLFVLTDCTQEIIAMQADLPQKIESIKAVACAESEPCINIGEHCFVPYPCIYKKYCFETLPSPNVFDVGFSMNLNTKNDLYRKGIVSFDDIIKSETLLSPMQKKQIETTACRLPPYIEKNQIEEFLSQLTYPLYFLDFETMQFAIPQYDNTSPYEKIPFQYSLHIQNCLGGGLSHKEFLAQSKNDPRRALAQQLCNDIPHNSCILAYHASFEKACISRLAQLFEDLSSQLTNIQNKIVDLATPFALGHYYCREMAGSYSIKKVLPALYKNDPSLDYTALNLVHNGSEAMDIFPRLQSFSPSQQENIRKALLEYCKLDTFAMVKILEKLYEAIR